MRGAGGTEGGTGSFILGLVMLSAGLYLLLDSIVVSNSFSLGYPLWRVPVAGTHFNLTSGGMLLPLMAGIALIFYNARMVWGWVLAIGALTAVLLGVILSLSISMRSMSLLNLLLVLTLTMGGLGLFLRSLRRA